MYLLLSNKDIPVPSPMAILSVSLLSLSSLLESMVACAVQGSAKGGRHLLAVTTTTNVRQGLSQVHPPPK